MVDWRKRRTVYLGIEYARFYGEDSIEQNDVALDQYRNRRMDSATFHRYYWFGIEAKASIED